MKNIFVMGLDAFHLELLETIRGPEEYAFHPLFDFNRVVHLPEEEYPSLESLLREAQETFEDFSGSVDAVMGYWDLPTTLAVPLIAERFGLPGAPLEAVARCEHKYWSRTLQKEVLPDMIPAFQAVDPFADDPVAGIELEYPFWIKPVKAHSSYLGFYIDRPETLRRHLPEIRAGIGIMGRPLNEFLANVTRPPEIEGVSGFHCIAEDIVSRGFQCTLEGYFHDDHFVVYGVVDSIRSGRHRSCFARYQYPSKLPRAVQARMIDAAERVIDHLGYRDAPFNIEFYWDPDTDHISLLEINTRISKSHSPLFLMVDGATNQKVTMDLALGQAPVFPHREGAHRIAGKFMLRYFDDGILERVPTDDDILRVQEKYPEARIRRLATRGSRLSELALQDSYSFEVAEIFLGADRQKALLDKYDDVLGMLDFRVRPLERKRA